MQIHELNNFNGTPGATNFLAIDNGSDTARISGEALLDPVNSRIDNLTANVLPDSIETILDWADVESASKTLSKNVSGFDYLDLYFKENTSGTNRIVFAQRYPRTAFPAQVTIPVISWGGGTDPKYLYFQDLMIAISGTTLTMSQLRIYSWDGKAADGANIETGILVDQIRVDGVKISSNTSAELTDLRTAHDGTVYASARAAREADYNALDSDIKTIRNDLNIGDFYGFVFPKASQTYRLEQKMLNDDNIELLDIIEFTANKSINSQGVVFEYEGYSATEGFYQFPVDVIVKNKDSDPSTIFIAAYDLQGGFISRISVYRGDSYTIPHDSNKQYRFAVSLLEFADLYEISCNTSGIVFKGINNIFDAALKQTKLVNGGNAVTNKTAGYIQPNGIISTATNYFYTNKISVDSGDILSFWYENNGEILPAIARFLTAYNANDAAVTASGGTNIYVYTVPDGIDNIIASFSTSYTNNIMVCSGVNKPSEYMSSNDIYRIAKDEFINDSVYKLAMDRRSNKLLKDGIRYYLDENSIYCYCKPNNLTTAKVNIYHNYNEAQDGSSACFVDFAANKIGFYNAFGIYSRGSLTVKSEKTASIEFNADHEYLIKYTRKAISPIYTLTITDLMTLEADTFTDTGGGNGWGYIGFDNIDVTVSEFKRICDSPINPTVLIIGDSYTEGMTLLGNRDKRWCYLLGQAVGSFAINGQGGARSDMMLKWLDDYLLDVFNPKYVIIETGTNEAHIDYFSRYLTTISAKLKAKNIQPILCTVPVTTAKPNPSDYNAFVLGSGLPYIDICRALTINGDRTTQDTSLFLDDMIHPNIDGHRKIFEMAKLNIPELFREIY